MAAEPSTAEILPVTVQVGGRSFLWTPGTGLDPAVVEACVPFVAREANRLRGVARSRGLSTEDLIQDGCVGLLEAARRFDPLRGTTFLTYACWWVRQAQLHALQERAVHLSSREAEQLRRAGATPPCCSLDTPLPSGDPLWVLLEAPGEQEPALHRHLAWSLIHQGLGLLHGRAREVLIRRHGLTGQRPETLAAVAASWGCSRERVRQIQIQAESRLRRLLARLPLHP